MTCIYSFGSTPKANGHVPSGLVSNGPSGGGKSGQAMRNGQHISEKVTSVPLSNGQAANDQQDLKVWYDPFHWIPLNHISVNGISLLFA